MAGFRSLRERAAGAADAVLPLSVLPYMRQPLLNWLYSVSEIGYRDSHWELLAQMLKIDYVRTGPQKAILKAADEDNDLILDLVDARLSVGGTAYAQLDELKLALTLAGSGWQVNDADDGLEQVVVETVRDVALAAIREAADSPSEHLAKAWTETFGRVKNPTLAHAEMIRAVESAAIPVLTPKDLRATLGTVIGQMENQGHLYTTVGASDANNGVAAVVAMMKLLWQQQTDRHGANPTVPASQERVEMLLPVAAALVHMFVTGAVLRAT